MHLAILHYHLNRGGVTQVILNQLHALRQSAGGDGPDGRVVILYGGRKNHWPDKTKLGEWDPELIAVPGLEYDDEASPTGSLERDLAEVLGDRGLDPESTLIHAHNHALGKNVRLPAALWHLGESGYSLLLQVHDFAEDLRPRNYRALVSEVADGDADVLPERLYRYGPGTHYAVLNGRDRRILTSAGIPDAHVHMLPNPVGDRMELPDPAESRALLNERLHLDPGSRLWVYPVRGIRRKNIGEMLLWSAVGSGRIYTAMTLPPSNPRERVAYDAWEQKAEALHLPCCFDLAHRGGLSLMGNLAAGERVFTSSVAEGFGMVFLEAWQADRELTGRDLPEITADFVESGLQFPTLYSALRIPVDWLDREAFLDDMAEICAALLESYSAPNSDIARLRTELEGSIEDEAVDFARLPYEYQQAVVTLLARDAGRREGLLSRNPSVAEALGNEQVDHELIRANQAAIAEHYSLRSAGSRLTQLYERVHDDETPHTMEPVRHGSRILETFLGVDRLQPVRWQR